METLIISVSQIMKHINTKVKELVQSQTALSRGGFDFTWVHLTSEFIFHLKRTCFAAYW